MMVEPYALVGEVERFSQKNTAFARAGWDPASPAYDRRARPPEEVAASGGPGYSREDYALHAGAWAVARFWRAHKEPAPMGPNGEGSESSAARQGDAEDRDALTRQVKGAARFFGASLVGIARVNPLWVYVCDVEGRPIELPEGMNTALVMAIAMDYEMMRTSPSVRAAAATGMGYSRMAFAAMSVARYLSDLGWRAIPCGNDTALTIPLAIDAGLGEPGRNGLLITAPFGPRVRVCKVFTDAPLVVDTPVSFGVREFCEVCAKCVTSCPAAAIPRGRMTAAGPTPSNNPGVLKWYVNPDKCLAFWRNNGVSCANCVRSCPFNKPHGRLHDLARLFVRARSRLPDRALLLLDSWCGYGRRKDAT